MGQESKHQNSYPRLEEVLENGQIRSEDRRYIVNLVNLTIKELWGIAYQAGFEDGMSFISKEK
jgi:hypothetical protein